jgi:hypothetical protein
MNRAIIIARIANNGSFSQYGNMTAKFHSVDIVSVFAFIIPSKGAPQILSIG